MAGATPDRPDDLPGLAQPAWEAYHAMVETKTRHFDFLSALDRKYAHGGRRSLAEIAHLDTLLAAHTAAVRDFGRTMAELARQNVTARDALVARLQGVNAGLGKPLDALH